MTDKRDFKSLTEADAAGESAPTYRGRHFKGDAAAVDASAAGEGLVRDDATLGKATHRDAEGRSGRDDTGALDASVADAVSVGIIEPRPAVPDGDNPGDRRNNKRRRRGSKGRVRRRILIGLSVVLVLLAVAAGGAFAWWRHSVEAGRLALTQATRDKADDGTIEYDGKRYRLNEDVVSVCFLGYDGNGNQPGKGGQCDSIVVLAFNTKTGEVKGISIPRDSMVTVDAYSGESYAGQTTEQICLQYSYGDGGHRSSELTANTVSRVLYGVPITYYLTLDIDGIGPMNNAVGGVALTPQVSVPMYSIVAGQELRLSGKQAEGYVRHRDDSATGSVDRSKRQVQYIQAFATQVLARAKQNPASLMDLFNQAQRYIYTNLGVDEFSYLADQVLAHGVSSLEITSLEGEAKLGTSFSEFYLDSDSVQKAVVDTFYTEVNGDGSTGESATENAAE